MVILELNFSAAAQNYLKWSAKNGEDVDRIGGLPSKIWEYFSCWREARSTFVKRSM